ncbi:MAG TPA: O-antigen ligase family protein [Gammaproteobacteria bacterium]|nr:O-antigen ligase family protein [Gammaproteobacteria bacterium]
MLIDFYKDWASRFLIFGVFCLPLSVSLDNFIFLSALMSLLLFYFSPLSTPVPLKYCYVIGGGFLCWMMMTSFVFNQPDVLVWKQLSRYARDGVVFAGVSLLVLKTRGWLLDNMCKGLVLGCLPGVVISLVCYSPVFFISGSINAWLRQLYDMLMVGSIPFGIMVVFSMVFCFLKGLKGSSRGYWAVGLVLSLYVMLCSGQRLVMLLWFFALIYMVYVYARDVCSWRQMLGLFVVTLALGVVVMSYFSPHFYGGFAYGIKHLINPETNHISESISTRLFFHYICWQMLSSSWLYGFGLGSFNTHLNHFYADKFKAFEIPLQTPESSYAHIAAETGIVGLLLWVALIVFIFRCMGYLPERWRDFGYALWLFFIVATAIISTCVDHSSSMFFMTFLGGVVGMIQTSEQEAKV